MRVGSRLVFVGWLVAVLAVASGSPAGHVLRVLQLNLCDSGIAECYTGRAVAEAVSAIRTTQPDVVTLDEVCQADVSTLAPGFGAAVFRAAGDRRTGGPFRCRDGTPYGIGLLVRNPGHHYSTTSGLYPAQDLRDPEERAWVCVDSGLRVCATHLASTSASVAREQCGYLMRTVAHGPAVVGGDFNLGDVRACGSAVHRSDGAVQQVVATTGFAVGAWRTLDMHGTTDHPGLLVTLTGAAGL